MQRGGEKDTTMPHIGVTSPKNTASINKTPQNHRRQWLQKPQKLTPSRGQQLSLKLNSFQQISAP